ncbi:MAG: hypothetical protein CMI54_02935 [Parcubacteria group bacterium]|nr:hypothetical protein [Parcubacteria group bacterium]|tara:strand:- start:17492 stop:18007 length:516 start_codon:yes stop_codon:yes gene_type:complete
MADYSIKTEDDKGRQIQPILSNTAKDGSGTWYFALVDSSGRLVMGTSTAEIGKLAAGTAEIGKLAAGTAVIGKVGHDTTGLGDGRETVDAAGTAQAIVTSSTPAKWVIVTAETDNTDYIAVGASTVVAALATRRGTALDSGESVTILCDDLDEVFIDAVVTNEGVTFTYGT